MSQVEIQHGSGAISDHTEVPSPSADRSMALAGAHDPAATGSCGPEMSFLTTSSSTEASPGSGSKRSASPMSDDAEISPRQGGSRSHSPAGLPLPVLRAVHRRIDVPLDKADDAIRALLEQSRAD